MRRWHDGTATIFVSVAIRGTHEFRKNLEGGGGFYGGPTAKNGDVSLYRFLCVDLLLGCFAVYKDAETE